MFNKQEWERHQSFNTSWFMPYSSPEYNSWYIHVDIIIFDGVGMKLYPWSYVAFQVWSFVNRDKKDSKFIEHEWV